MGKMNKIMAEWTMLWATLLFAMLAACSSDSGVAGILIETNTGNKVLIETNTGNGFARVMISVADFEISEGDTLQLSRTERDTVGDTIRITSYYTEDVVNAVDVALGYAAMDSVPALDYDSLIIVPMVGEVRSIAVEVTAEEGGTYRIDDDGVSIDSNIAEITKISVELPEGFEDLSSTGESFKDMPLPVRLEKPAMNPCLVDANGNVIVLEKGESDSLLYWGRMDQVVFAEDGSIKFDLLESCNLRQDSMVLARRALHLDDAELSEGAAARIENAEGVLGNALWLDSTDSWKMVEGFEPFADNGTQMSASIWIKADSASQATPGKSYTRILSAKKDSVAFILQQRSNQAAVNLRIDARHDGEGVYNSTYGTARILDGAWHNYSFTIRGDSVFTYVDGVNHSKDRFEYGGDFSTCTNPAIGGDSPNLVGGLDEIFFFDGSQSENWMRLFYALQKQAMK